MKKTASTLFILICTLSQPVFSQNLVEEVVLDECYVLPSKTSISKSRMVRQEHPQHELERVLFEFPSFIDDGEDTILPGNGYVYKILGSYRNEYLTLNTKTSVDYLLQYKVKKKVLFVVKDQLGGSKQFQETKVSIKKNHFTRSADVISYVNTYVDSYHKDWYKLSNPRATAAEMLNEISKQQDYLSDMILKDVQVFLDDNDVRKCE